MSTIKSSGSDDLTLYEEEVSQASNAIFTEEFLTYQAEFLFATTPEKLNWQTEDVNEEIVYSITPKLSNTVFAKTPLATICLDALEDVLPDTKLVTIDNTSTNIINNQTSVEIQLFNSSIEPLKLPKARNKNTDWLLYREYGSNSEIVLIANESTTAPTIDILNREFSRVFDTSNNWTLMFADIEAEILNIATTTDQVFITNHSEELLSYTIAELTSGTRSEYIEVYPTSTDLMQTFNDLLFIDFTNAFDTNKIHISEDGSYNTLMLCYDNNTSKEVACVFTLPEYINLRQNDNLSVSNIDLVQIYTILEDIEIIFKQSWNSWITII